MKRLCIFLADRVAAMDGELFGILQHSNAGKILEQVLRVRKQVIGSRLLEL